MHLVQASGEAGLDRRFPRNGGATLKGMRAVMLEVDEALVAQRRRLGLDVFDEMWEGELHMVPPPSGPHQGLGTNLLVALVHLAKRRSLLARYEIGVYRHSDDYRVPDLAVARPQTFSERGIDGPPELVVEILSPGDESRTKLGWYAALGVSEMMLVDPRSLTLEAFRGIDRQAAPVTPDAAGAWWSEVLQASLAPGEGTIRITWDGGQAEVRPD